MPANPFIHLSAATLATMQTNYEAAVNAIAVGAQSYSLAGRTVTRANLDSLTRTLGQISEALAMKQGTASIFVAADMSNGA